MFVRNGVYDFYLMMICEALHSTATATINTHRTVPQVLQRNVKLSAGGGGRLEPSYSGLPYSTTLPMTILILITYLSSRETCCLLTRLPYLR